ncbi:hypothetical protein PAMA_022003 [Pampus argenteus]
MLPQKLLKIKREEVSDEDMDTAQSAAGHRERVREMAVRMATEAGLGSSRRAGEGDAKRGKTAAARSMDMSRQYVSPGDPDNAVAITVTPSRFLLLDVPTCPQGSTDGNIQHYRHLSMIHTTSQIEWPSLRVNWYPW